MPSFITFGVINTNTPNQNAGIFIGETNLGGCDANQKQTSAVGTNFGIACFFARNVNISFDNFEFIDGMINDQDVKIPVNTNL